MVVVNHPTGNTFVRALLDALQAHDLKPEFHSTVAFSADNPLLALLPNEVRAAAQRRAFAIPSQSLRAHPLRELGRLMSGRFSCDLLDAHERGIFSVDAVYQSLDRAVARRIAIGNRRGIRAVYGYEDGSYAMFQAARAEGIPCVYELPIAYWETSKRLLSEEAERWPEWEPTLVGTRDSQRKLERKSHEVELANVIVCPSNFVERSLPPQIREARRCVVAEFGSPAVQDFPSDRTRSARERPLQVLFAGSMSQRKGLADLFAAMKMLNRSDVELVIMGSPLLPMEFYRNQGVEFRYEPPRPHADVLKLMQRCDLLVLPSIVEGRALVQQEAMSCGLPLLITPNTGGEDLIEEGSTGFTVPIRTPLALAEKLAWCADHRDQLDEMRLAAQRKARECTWQRYGEKIVREILALSAESKKNGC